MREDKKDLCAMHAVPVMVPCTIEPFLSSIVTVSLFSFIRKLQVGRPKVARSTDGDSSSGQIADAMSVIISESICACFVPHELHDCVLAVPGTRWSMVNFEFTEDAVVK